MILTKAISGLARSGATRAGYPVLQGAKVPLYALSNIARSGATRSNYTSTKPFIRIDGIHRGWGRIDGGGVIADSVTKSDAINNTPVTLTFTAYGWVPVEGADVVITLGSMNNLARQFGGTILSTRHRYVRPPVARNMLYDVSCIDYTWSLDNRKVSGNYTNASVAAIAASLMTYAPAGYTLLVDPDIGAEILNQITFTEQTLTGAFAQLAKRVGGDFLCDYLKVVHLFFENTALTAPRIVNAVHPTLQTIDWTRDLSQVATRILGSFGGSNALDQIGPGETLLPVETAAWYLPAGGVVLVGQQRVTYGGLEGGGGGSLVGPGASPTGAPNAALLPGAGVTVGSHDYAVTFKTVNGESLAGPRVTVPVGVFLAPTTAPTAGTPGPGGGGPQPGVHDYAVSFVLSSGETTPGPRVTVSTTLTPNPDKGPTPDLVSPGPGPDPGVHDYAVSFVTLTGETLPSPIGGQVTTGGLGPPTSAPSPGSPTAGPGPDPGPHQYASTFVRPEGETTIGPVSGVVTTGTIPVPITAPPSAPTVTESTGSDAVFSGGYHVYVTFVTAVGETTVGPGAPFTAVLWPNNRIDVSNLPIGPPEVTARRIYSKYDGSSNVYVNLLADNTSPTFHLVAGTLYSGGGQVGPPTNTAGMSQSPQQTVRVSGLPIAPAGAGVIARKLYRYSANVWGLVATVNDNTTTSYTDTTPNASRGPSIPTSTTTTGGRQTVHLSNIARGTGASSAAVLQRNLYRRSAGAGLRLVNPIPDNSSTTYVDTMANASLGAAPHTTNTADLRTIPLSNLPIGNSLVTGRIVYRTSGIHAGGTIFRLFTFNDNTTTECVDGFDDASLGGPALTVGTAQAAQVQLSAIPLGAAAVTARVLYRTKAGATPLQALVTLADNVTTAYLDVLADAALGATAPTSDTSLLQQPVGTVLAGSPTLPCATIAAFRTIGGWAIVGSQNIRYTGISGNALLGIPPSGPGAITATITYNTTVVAAAMLTKIPATGLGVIKYPILKGDPVNVFVQVDDLAAQAAVRLQLPGSDGIIEDEIQDGRLSYIEGVARCQARLDLLGALDSEGKVGVITVSYVCRDINTHAGATVTVNLGPPVNVRGDFLIQRVGVARFNIPNLNPTYTVEASSLRFAAEEMLRLLRQGAF
jgi:hypothetical protein